MRTVVLALLFIAPFAAPQAAEPIQKARVEGRVVTSEGEAVSKASVTLTGPGLPPTQPTTTDSEGKFAFEDLTPGKYTYLEVEKVGFLTQRLGAVTRSAFGTTLNLMPGMDLKDLVVPLTQQGTMAGHVTDPDGDPVANATVQVYGYSYARARKELRRYGTASTDDKGDFRTTNLAPGRYFISAEERRVTPSSQSSATARDVNVATYYPNGLDASEGKSVEVLEGGAVRGIDIQLRRGRIYMIRGKVFDTTTNSSPAGVQIALGNRIATISSANGAFVFTSLAPGTYTLRVGPASVRGPGGRTGRVDVTISNSGVEGLVLPIGPGLEIDGVLRWEDGDVKTLVLPTAQTSSPPPVRVATMDGQPGVVADTRALPSVSLSQWIGNAPDVFSISATFKDDGSMHFQGLAAGSYMLNLSNMPEGVYAKSIRFGDQDVTNGPLDIESGGTMSIVLSSKGAEVSGIARNDKGGVASGAIVTICPKVPDPKNNYHSLKQAYSDQNGAFKFTGLPPGEYFLAAWDGLEPGLWQGDEFVRHFDAESSPIRLEEGAHVTHDPKLIPAERLAAEMAKLP